MIGLVLVLIYVGYAAIVNSSVPQAVLGAANFLFWWWAIWGAVWFFGFGFLGFIGLGFSKSVAERLGTCVISGVVAMLLGLTFGVRCVCAWLIYSSAPSNVTSWSEFDTTKVVIAGIIFVVTFILSKLGGTHQHTPARD